MDVAPPMLAASQRERFTCGRPSYAPPLEGRYDRPADLVNGSSQPVPLPETDPSDSSPARPVEDLELVWHLAFVAPLALEQPVVALRAADMLRHRRIAKASAKQL